MEDLGGNRFSKFIPDRLIEAREARGFTLTDLANIVEISHQAISKYEKEKATPNHDTLEKLSDALHVPVTYFYKSYPKKVDGVIYFRSMAMATENQRTSIFIRLVGLRKFINTWNNISIFPKLNVPCSL
ncbi:helix-turn-helix transcriptional regulator [Paenibacillus larvae]|nr:helix-turn-helix transcriptional regulator [Paenibacillus larvae]MDT2261969.1 helix-turn-helix transcriptional regulator [Paenibacillus larvae]